jgi:hypothetical protein
MPKDGFHERTFIKSRRASGLFDVSMAQWAKFINSAALLLWPQSHEVFPCFDVPLSGTTDQNDSKPVWWFISQKLNERAYEFGNLSKSLINSVDY